MNLSVVALLLSRIALFIAATMVFSLPWASPACSSASHFETRGFLALLAAIGCSLAAAGVLWRCGRNTQVQIFRKEAMAVVGLSWVMATVLGALPYWFAGVERQAGEAMNPADWVFESQSGFSTTGATVIADIDGVDRCILFWRSSTHFLGGLGIIVLFVAVLGQGSAGKALMRAEMPGPSKEGYQARMQQTALWFAGIYIGLNAVLTVLLMFGGLSLFDALCHAFGTMATGGFSTHNESVGYFALPQNAGQYSPNFIDVTILIFMILAGANFSLLYCIVIMQPHRLWADVEWKTYIAILALATVLVVSFGMWHHDFDPQPAGGEGAVNADESFGPRLWRAFRFGAFQVVSIMTTTGYGTHDFNGWNNFGRGLLFLLMFVGGCAGSTGGGLKVIRHVLFVKILRLEVEQAYHPSVVRPLRLGGQPVEDQELRKNILVYFGLVLMIVVVSWLMVITFEPDATWQANVEHKLIDSASAVAATLNNIGPGLGTIGATQNYAHFSWLSKLLFTVLMMLGRLELFPIIVLGSVNFWRSR